MDRVVTVVALAEAIADRVVTAKEGFRNHWYLTVRREHFLATSSVMPFLCIQQKTWVQVILWGFLYWVKKKAFFEDSKQYT